MADVVQTFPKGSGGIINGYYNPANELFYADQAYQTAIPGRLDVLYISVDTDSCYRFNGTIFVMVGGKSETIQVDQLPIGSATELGKVYQYIGASTSTLVHGHFYECFSNGATPPVYSWDSVSLTNHLTNEELQELKDAFDLGTGADRGHIIEDKDETILTQRTIMQFAGDLETTDDLDDEKTVVKNHLLTDEEVNSILSPLPKEQLPGPLDYSTEEKVVGTWINGEPLYQKTLTGRTSISAVSWCDTGIVTPANCVLVDLSGVRYLDSDGWQILQCIGRIENGNLFIFNLRNNAYAVADIVVTIRYTKTTD